MAHSCAQDPSSKKGRDDWLGGGVEEGAGLPPMVVGGGAGREHGGRTLGSQRLATPQQSGSSGPGCVGV